MPWQKRVLHGGAIFFALLSLAGSVRVLREVYTLGRKTAAAPEAPASVHFALFLPDNRSPFFTDLIRGAEQAARETGIALSVHSVDPEKMELEMAPWSGFDGVIVCPYLEDSLARRQMEKLRDHGIPAVLINYDLSGGDWPYVGTSNYEIGRNIAAVIRRIHRGPARPAVVYSEKAPGISDRRERVERGISDGLGELLAAPVVRLETNRNPLDVWNLPYPPPPREAPEQQFDVIVFTNTTDTENATPLLAALNAGNATGNAGNAAGTIMAVGFGMSPEIERCLREGILACTIVTHPEKIGGEALRSLEKLYRTGYTSRSVNTGISIIHDATTHPARPQD